MLLVIGCHGWVEEAAVVMVRLWPTRRHTGLGCSPVRAVMVGAVCEHTGSTGNGTPEAEEEEVEGEPGRAALAVAAEPAEPEEPVLSCAPEPETETGPEPVPTQEASTTRSPPMRSVLNPIRSNRVPGMDASPGCARFFGD